MRNVFRHLILMVTSAACLYGQSSACTVIKPWKGDFEGIRDGWSYVPGRENPNPIQMSGVGSTAWPATQLETLIDVAEAVYLVRVQLKPVETVPSLYSDLSLMRAVLVPTSTLKGEDVEAFEYVIQPGMMTLVVDFENSGPEWQVGQADFEAAIDQQRRNHKENFWYWDEMLSSAPTVVAPYALSTCGPDRLAALSEASEYLVAIDDGAITVMEPVTGIDDPLVEAASARISDVANRMSKTIAFATFAAEFDYAAVVTVEKCSIWLQQQRENGYYRVEDRFAVRKHEHAVTFKFKQFKRMSASETTEPTQLAVPWPVFFDYFDMDTQKLPCDETQEYLVLGRDFHVTTERPFKGAPEVLERYARIENGRVLIEDIMTNYLFSDAEAPSVDSILRMFPLVIEVQD